MQFILHNWQRMNSCGIFWKYAQHFKIYLIPYILWKCTDSFHVFLKAAQICFAYSENMQRFTFCIWWRCPKKPDYSGNYLICGACVKELLHSKSTRNKIFCPRIQNLFFPRILTTRAMSFKFEYLGNIDFTFKTSLGKNRGKGMFFLWKNRGKKSVASFCFQYKTL
jgi:hypothetical protein